MRPDSENGKKLGIRKQEMKGNSEVGIQKPENQILIILIYYLTWIFEFFILNFEFFILHPPFILYLYTGRNSTIAVNIYLLPKALFGRNFAFGGRLAAAPKFCI